MTQQSLLLLLLEADAGDDTDGEDPNCPDDGGDDTNRCFYGGFAAMLVSWSP